jgi:hypothetical protein
LGGWKELTQESQARWDTIAEFWDDYMGGESRLDRTAAGRHLPVQEKAAPRRPWRLKPERLHGAFVPDGRVFGLPS